MKYRLLNNLIDITFKSFEEERKGSYYLNLTLGMIIIKWANDSSQRYNWIVPDDAKWENLRIDKEKFKNALEKSGKSLEENNPSFKDIFTYYCFDKLDLVSGDLLYKYFNIIDSFDFTDENSERDITGQYFKMYLNLLEKEQPNLGITLTPDTIRKLLPEILRPIPSSEIGDPTAGVGSYFISCKEYIESKGEDPSNLKFYGQEIDKDIYILCKINLLFNGITGAEVKLGDTLRDPKLIENQRLKQFDYIFSDFPLNLSKWGVDEAKLDKFGRFRYGLPSNASGDWAFIQHIIASMKPTGKAAVIITKGTLVRKLESNIRQKVFEDDLIEAVISLPENLYSNTSIPVNILILNKNKSKERKGKILIIDASKEYETEKKLNFLNHKQINRIATVFNKGLEEYNYSKFITLDKIKDNDWTLNIIEYMKINDIKEKLKDMIKLKDVADIFRGVQVSKKQLEKLSSSNNKTHYFINIGDVQDGKISFKEDSKLEPKNDRWTSLYEIKPGDVLISSRGTLIKTAVVPDDAPPAIISGNLACIRLNKKKCDPYLLKFYIDSPVARVLLEGIQTGTSIKVLNYKELGNLLIPKLDIKKQKEISNEIVKNEKEYEKRIKEANKIYNEKINSLYEKINIKDILN